MSARVLTIAMAASMAALAHSGLSFAVTPTCATGETECARSAFALGTESFDRRDYEAARAWFLAAVHANPHPVVVFNLALSEARSGKPLAAVERFRALLASGEAEPELRARSERELRRAESLVARVSFELPNISTIKVFLNAVEVTLDSAGFPVNPGSHRIWVQNRDETLFDQDVDLAPGERLQIRVSSRMRSIDVVLVPSEPAEHRQAARRAEPAMTLRTGGLPRGWFYAAAATSTVLAGLTVWSGLDVQRAYDEYRAALPRLTQARADARVRDGHARERRTNALLAATALSAAGTIVLGTVFTTWSTSDERASIMLSTSGISASARF